MTRYIIRRLLLLIPLVIGVTIITFAVANLAPGSPLQDLQLNPDIQPADLHRIEDSLGLNKPLYVRYFTWFSHVIRGDFGISLVTYRPVLPSILQKLPNTLELTVAALLFALIVSIPVGVYAAVHRNSLFDQISTLGAVAGFAIPSFWLGLMMILLFSVEFQAWGLPHFPTGSVCTLGACTIGSRIIHLIMPAFVLGFVQMASWTRYIRTQVIEVMGQDYLRTAQAKGLLDRIVIIRHALRNAMLPLITIIALDLPNLFGGAVIIEQIFTWNGLGSFILDAVNKRDYTVVLDTTLFISVLVIVCNLLADIAYAVVDPRIKYD